MWNNAAFDEQDKSLGKKTVEQNNFNSCGILPKM